MDKPHHIVILGLGAEAQSALTYFEGAESLAVFDDAADKLKHLDNTAIKRLPSLAELDAHAQAERVGAFWLRAPGMRPDHPALQIAAHRQIPVTTFTSFWIARHSAHVRATITGTKGKSSVTALTGAILQACGETVRVGGNIGVTPTSPPGLEDWVFEMSSYQLHDCLAAAPVHCFTSLHPEHLDWHGDLKSYGDAKMRPYILDTACKAIIARELTPLLVGKPNPVWVAEDVLDWRGGGLTLHTEDGHAHLLPLVAETRTRLAQDPVLLHNARLAGATAFACGRTGAEAFVAGMAQALATWKGLPLRQEIIGDFARRVWVNDALATIPQATLAALRRFEGRTVRLILGGKERHQDFSPLAAYLNATPNVHAYVYADAADRLEALLARKPRRATDFLSLIARAFEESSPGDVILFSPSGATPEPGGNYLTRADIFARFAASKATGSP